MSLMYEYDKFYIIGRKYVPNKNIFKRAFEVASRRIQSFQYGCEYTHIRILDPTDPTKLIEADWDGVVHIDYKYNPENETIFWVPVAPGTISLIYSFLMKQVGKDYDYWGLLGFLSRKQTESPNKWFCSELASAAAREGNSPIFNWDFVKPWQVSPHWLIGSAVETTPKELKELGLV